MPDPVVAEELDLLAKVTSLLDELPRAKTASEAPIAWPGLADTPVWPGGKPQD